ncbi:MAG: type III pantothenate kinase [Bacteroidia bacterium]|nr:type III pantothenate kinase [Bacteroidia bacterium]MCZ2276714.1 type III pantothenate kinase [Bacteroidia bacterium]
MNLLIDSGNTCIKTAGFTGRKMVFVKVFNHEDSRGLVKLLKSQAFNTIMVSDVGNTLNKPVFKGIKIQKLHSGIPLPVKLNYRPKSNLGQDRICNAAAASFLFPKNPVLIIDCGSCLKTDLVINSEFTGGSISPGLSMRYRSLHEFTAALPQLKPVKNFKHLGNSTESSITSGVQAGMVAEIEAKIKFVRQQSKSLKIILTGGDWHFFVNQLKSVIFVAPELTLIGLNEILLYNLSSSK